MSGTKEGGKKAAETNRKRRGKDFYKQIGRKGGKAGHTGGFASDTVGSDGLTGYQRAIIAGRKGGKNGKRGAKKKPAVKKPEEHPKKRLWRLFQK